MLDGTRHTCGDELHHPLPGFAEHFEKRARERNRMSSEPMLATGSDYREWLGQLKTRFRQVQLKAAVAVNSALLQFYWELGADIVAKQEAFAWGSGFLNQLSADLVRDFPDVKGFSPRNLKYIRQWRLFWQGEVIGQ